MESKKCANCGTALTGKELVCWGCGVDVNDDSSFKEISKQIYELKAVDKLAALVFKFCIIFGCFSALMLLFYGFLYMIGKLFPYGGLFFVLLLGFLFVFLLGIVVAFWCFLFFRFKDGRDLGQRFYVILRERLHERRVKYLELLPWIILLLTFVVFNLGFVIRFLKRYTFLRYTTP